MTNVAIMVPFENCGGANQKLFDCATGLYMPYLPLETKKLNFIAQKCERVHIGV